MGKLIEVKCPGCAAALRIDGELSHATCEYCGALSEIRRETAPKTLLNMMRPPPPPPVDGPKVIRVSSVGKGCLIAILLPPALFVLLFIVLVIIFAIKEAVNDGPASQPAATGPVAVPTTDSGGPTRSTWLGHRQPLLFDASGDGSDDVIGWVRSTAEAAGGEHLTAFDPIAGRTLWTSARLGESASSQKLHTALADGRVLVADAGGVLHGLDARTGVELWRTSLEERLDRYCGQGPGRVGLVLVDRRVLVVEVATGQVRPNRETACQPLWTDEPGDTPLVDIAGRLFHNDAKRLPRLAGVDVTLGLRELATGHQAATGLRAAGTRIPLVVGFDGAGRKAKARWTRPLANVGLSEVKEEEPRLAFIARGRLVAPYAVTTAEGDRSRLAAFNVQDGVRLWDVAVPGTAGPSPLAALVISDRFVFYSHFTVLDIFDLASGAHRVTLGTPL